MAKAAMGFATQFVVMKFVAPTDQGLWASMMLATTYAQFMLLGINNGLNRELHFTLGAGENQQAMRLAGTAQTMTLIGCILAAITGAGALVLLRDHNRAFLTAVIVETIAVICFFYQSYLSVTYRSASAFKALAIVDFIGVGVGLAALVLIVFGGFEGMLWRVALISVLAIVLMHLSRPIRVGLTWDNASLRLLLKTGIPIFALFYIEASLSTFDRLFLLKTGGTQQVGFYALALAVQTAMFVVPTSLSAYVYPRMTFQWGRNHDRRELWSMAWRATATAVGAMAPIAVIGAIALPIVVPRLFPSYQPGIAAAQIIAIGCLFNDSMIGVNALWSMKAWRPMAIYQVGGALLRAAGAYFGVAHAANPLIGVAVGMSTAYLLQFSLGLALTYYVTMLSSSDGAQVAA